MITLILPDQLLMVQDILLGRWRVDGRLIHCADDLKVVLVAALRQLLRMFPKLLRALLTPSISTSFRAFSILRS